MTSRQVVNLSAKAGDKPITLPNYRAGGVSLNEQISRIKGDDNDTEASTKSSTRRAASVDVAHGRGANRKRKAKAEQQPRSTVKKAKVGVQTSPEGIFDGSTVTSKDSTVEYDLALEATDSDVSSLTSLSDLDDYFDLPRKTPSKVCKNRPAKTTKRAGSLTQLITPPSSAEQPRRGGQVKGVPRTPKNASKSIPDSKAEDLVVELTEVDLASIDPDQLALSKKLEHRKPLGEKPTPRGTPLVWADSRQALCETLPYFKKPQGGCYSNDGHVYGFLFDSVGHCREYMDPDVIICRAGGGMEADSEGRMVQKRHQSLDEWQPAALLNDIKHKNPLIVICGNRNEKAICQMPHQYCVLDWFKPVAVWSEKTAGKGKKAWNTIKYRLERLNNDRTTAWSSTSTWTVSEEDRLQAGPLLKASCHNCRTESSQVYLIGWMCLNADCEDFWKIDGKNAPCGSIPYNPAFLLDRAPRWADDDRLEVEPTSVRPALPKFDRVLGDHISYTNTRGVCCDVCGRCNPRRLFSGWLCETPDCTFTPLRPSHKPIMPAVLHTPWSSAPSLVRNKFDQTLGVTVQVSHQNHHKICKYTFDGVEGCFIHAAVESSVNQELDGPDEMLVGLQTQDIGLERRVFVVKKSTSAQPVETVPQPALPTPPETVPGEFSFHALNNNILPVQHVEVESQSALPILPETTLERVLQPALPTLPAATMGERSVHTSNNIFPAQPVEKVPQPALPAPPESTPGQFSVHALNNNILTAEPVEIVSQAAHSPPTETTPAECSVHPLNNNIISAHPVEIMLQPALPTPSEATPPVTTAPEAALPETTPTETDPVECSFRPLNNIILPECKSLVKQESDTAIEEAQEPAKPPKYELEDGDLMTAFSMNYGMPYKFVASGASRSFEAAPEAVNLARARLNWAARTFLEDSEGNKDFNEELIFAYLQGQKIEYHDDGESGLGPRIATLSLGGPATMHLRVKQKHYVGCSKVGLFTEEEPIPCGVGGAEMFDQRKRAWEELQFVKNDRVAYTQRRRELPRELGILEKRFKRPPDLLTITLSHGDIVLMDGYDIQKYMEHKVVSDGYLRFALTCRTVLEGHLKPEEMPTYPMLPETEAERYRGPLSA